MNASVFDFIIPWEGSGRKIFFAVRQNSSVLDRNAFFIWAIFAIKNEKKEKDWIFIKKY